VINNDSSKVISYINIWLSHLCFSLQKDIFNHRDISCFSFFNNGNILFLINVYSDSSQTALKHLKDTEANIYNILIMVDDFNIRNNNWNPFFPYHSSHSDLLIDIVDLIDLCLSKSNNQVSTRYSDNMNKSNSVIDLILLRSNLLELNSHTIHSKWRHSLDYAPLTVNISINEEILSRDLTLKVL